MSFSVVLFLRECVKDLRRGSFVFQTRACRVRRTGVELSAEPQGVSLLRVRRDAPATTRLTASLIITEKALG